MNNFVEIVGQVDELTALARDASKFATNSARHSDWFVFVASLCAFLNVIINVYMISQLQKEKQFNETLIGFIIASTGIVFAAMISVTSKMAALASSAVDASAAAARAVLATEVVREAVSTAAARAETALNEDVER